MRALSKQNHSAKFASKTKAKAPRTIRRAHNRTKHNTMFSKSSKRAISTIVNSFSNLSPTTKVVSVLSGVAGLSFNSAYKFQRAHNSSSTGKTSTTFDNGALQPNLFCFDPLVDFPLDSKLLITENVPTENANYFQQIDSLHGIGGAVTLNFDALPHPSTNFSNDFNWSKLQRSGSGTELCDRPLRLAVSTSGLSKSLAVHATIQGTPYILWGRSHLENLAIPGEDTTFLASEDALVFGHCGEDSDTRFEYVSLLKQHKDIIEKLHTSLRYEDDIERVRLSRQNKKLPKDIPKLGAQLINDLHDSHAGRTSLPTILINDQNEERVQFREQYLEQYPEYREHILTDDQKREYRAILSESKNQTFFLNSNLPLPVVTPLHSKTQLDHDQYHNADMSYSSLTTKEVFGSMSKDLPLMKRALLGIADGVGGMASYGSANETKEMSHQLMRLARHNLTSETRDARELLGQAYTSLLGQNSISVGACTSSLGLLSPAEPEEPEDEFDDGRRLKLSIANIGDSTVIAFRPKHNKLLGTTTYIPLAVAWPTYHSATGPALPPLQFTLFNYADKPPQTKLPQEEETPSTNLSTSHFSTPTRPHSGPSGGYNLYTSAADYRAFLAGKKPLSDFFQLQSLTKEQISAVNRRADFSGDLPWMAQSVENVTLRRGDVVCAFSDGIADNLQNEFYLQTTAQLWESVVAYVHPAVRVQHPAIRNVRPFFQIPSREMDHLNGAVLSRNHKPSLSEMLSNTEKLLSRLPENSIPPYSADEMPKTLFSLVPVCPDKQDYFLVKNSPGQSTLTSVVQNQQNQPPLSAEERDLLYKFNYATTQGARFHSTLSNDEEGVVAGTLATSMVGGLIRFSQRGSKFDDMSAICAVVY